MFIDSGIFLSQVCGGIGSATCWCVHRVRAVMGGEGGSLSSSHAPMMSDAITTSIDSLAVDFIPSRDHSRLGQKQIRTWFADDYIYCRLFPVVCVSWTAPVYRSAKISTKALYNTLFEIFQGGEPSRNALSATRSSAIQVQPFCINGRTLAGPWPDPDRTLTGPWPDPDRTLTAP